MTACKLMTVSSHSHIFFRSFAKLQFKIYCRLKIIHPFYNAQLSSILPRLSQHKLCFTRRHRTWRHLTRRAPRRTLTKAFLGLFFLALNHTRWITSVDINCTSWFYFCVALSPRSEFNFIFTIISGYHQVVKLPLNTFTNVCC